MREIVLDTETTGLHYKKGDKIIEIGCIELFKYIPTGKEFHVYLNPKKRISKDAFKIHGISNAFLSNKPTFQDIAKEFLEFIKQDTLIIHNAKFDIGFLNSELTNINLTKINFNRVKDTLQMARKIFPGSPNNLDALCKKFNINKIKRKKHTALLDSKLLSKVYLELHGGAQRELLLKRNKLSFKIEENQINKNKYKIQLFDILRRRKIKLARSNTDNIPLESNKLNK